MSTTASLDSTEVRLDPGDEVVIPLQIHNTGDIVEGYRIEVVGAPSSWALVDPPTVSLYPGSSTTATVTFRPPRSHAVPAGQQRFGVVVTPTEHPDEAVVPEGVIEVLPFLETVAELVPHTSQGRRHGRHQVAVDNRGNVPVTALLEGVDDGNRLDVRTSPPAVTVNPGEALFADVRVTPRRRLWRGSPVTFPFAVVVSPQESTSVSLAGSHVQQPTIPAWLPKLLLALLALLIALAALWFLVLEPTIESQARETAKEAVAPEVAAASESADQADSNADKADADADKAADSAAEGERTEKRVKDFVDKRVPGVRIGTPLSRRLLSDGSAVGSPQDTYTVPTGRRLEITDLVFSNPQGDFGRARVLRDGDTLFDVALENFRDLDYHFVTPINANDGSIITLDVDCRAPGNPPDAPAATACDIAMYLGGELTRPAQAQ